MSGIQGPTSGGGVDPTNLGDSTGAQPSASGASSDPTRLPSQPGVDPLRGGSTRGQRAGASFNMAGETTGDDAAKVGKAATAAATAAAQQRRDSQIREEGSDLMYLGFSPDQIDEIVDSRSASGDARSIFRKMPQLCNALGIESHSHDPQVAEQQDMLREQLTSLAKAGGPEALDALQNAYFNSTELDIGQLCEHLQTLGTIYGHSYEQLAEIGLHNADALRELRIVQEVLEGIFGAEARPSRVSPLGTLADRGGADAMVALRNVALTSDSFSADQLDDALKLALRGSGLQKSQIDRLFR